MDGEDQRSEAAVDHLYANHYRDHLQLLESHLFGRDDEEYEEVQDSTTGDWTPDEKDRFFAALRSHSALRPDLISSAVESKNIVEVCVFLATLEEAASRSDAESVRSTLDIAMEVSDDWIRAEEDQAAFLRDMELAWQDEASLKELDMVQDEPEGDAEVLALTRRRQKELKDLNVDHLKLMDRLLQDDEALLDRPSSPQLGDEPDTQTEADPPSNLAPAERRRLQKRLYMRRKRAEATGAEIDASSTKIQPGRKRKKAGESDAADEIQSVNPTQNELQPNSELEGEQQGKGAESEQELEPDGNPKKKKKGGLRREQKASRLFDELEVDSAVLHDQELDLFRLSSLDRFMSLYSKAYLSDATVTTISADTIRLLRAILADFVAQVVHRSIMLREQELKLKRQGKVWHLENADIWPETIERAVEMLGHASSKESVLEHLCEVDDDIADPEYDSDALEDYDIDARVGDGVENDDDGICERNNVLPSHPMHRELAPPLIRLTTHSNFTSSPSELLTPTETEEQELRQELADEEELDKQDQVLEKIHQDGLWALYKSIGVGPTGQ